MSKMKRGTVRAIALAALLLLLALSEDFISLLCGNKYLSFILLVCGQIKGYRPCYKSFVTWFTTGCGVVIKPGMERNGMEPIGACTDFYMFYFFSFNLLSDIVVCHVNISN